MTKKFNKVRYIELLKKSQNLESKYSSVWQEDDIEYSKLSSYRIMLENKIY
jgi:hypothetical protein